MEVIFGGQIWSHSVYSRIYKRVFQQEQTKKKILRLHLRALLILLFAPAAGHVLPMLLALLRPHAEELTRVPWAKSNMHCQQNSMILSNNNVCILRTDYVIFTYIYDHLCVCIYIYYIYSSSILQLWRLTRPATIQPGPAASLHSVD